MIEEKQNALNWTGKPVIQVEANGTCTTIFQNTKEQIKRRGIHLLTNNGRIQSNDICNIRFLHILMFPHKFLKETC